MDIDHKRMWDCCAQSDQSQLPLAPLSFGVSSALDPAGLDCGPELAQVHTAQQGFLTSLSASFYCKTSRKVLPCLMLFPWCWQGPGASCTNFISTLLGSSRLLIFLTIKTCCHFVLNMHSTIMPCCSKNRDGTDVSSNDLKVPMPIGSSAIISSHHHQHGYYSDH